MMYHPNGDGECHKISRKKFKQIFGISYKKSDYGVRFEDAHCGIDPYNEDICGTTDPLVCSSLEDYIETHNTYCYEI